MLLRSLLLGDIMCLHGEFHRPKSTLYRRIQLDQALSPLFLLFVPLFLFLPFLHSVSLDLSPCLLFPHHGLLLLMLGVRRCK